MSKEKDALSGGLQGASLGAVAGPYGALIGGGLGAAGGYFGLMPGTGQGDPKKAFKEVADRYAAYRPEQMKMRQEALGQAMSYFAPLQQQMQQKYGGPAPQAMPYFEAPVSGAPRRV